MLKQASSNWPVPWWLPTLLLALLLAVSQLGLLSLPVYASDKPRVVVTIAPLHSLVASVYGGDSVVLLISGSGSPHNASLRPSQLRALAAADVVFWVDPSLEPFLVKPLANIDARSEPLLYATGVQRLALRHGGVWAAADDDNDDNDPHQHHDRNTDVDVNADPHFWLDPRNGRAVIEQVRQVLSELHPAGASRYAANAARFDRELIALEQRLQTRLAPLKNQSYLVFHDAYQYFEHRFGLQPRGAVTLEPSLRPGARRLRELRTELQDSGARCVFSEPQFPSALVATLIEGSDIQAAVLDPLGIALTTGPHLYIELLQNLADNLQACLAS